jgi:hypothetical protein
LRSKLGLRIVADDVVFVWPPQARSAVLDSDPSNGQLREPWLKLLHLMRAMEYRPTDGREVELRVRRRPDATSMEDKIGMR